MDCRETQTLLTAFHDGELPAVDRARVEEHLRGCRECGALLADLARADQAAGVPDPGPAYWDRFNVRVMDRVTQADEGQGWPSVGAGRDAPGFEAPTGPKVAILRPKHGWMRQQLRYLVPAAAAAALVVVVVRFGGMQPGIPTTARDGLVPGQAGTPRVLSPRPAVSEPSAPGSAGQPMAGTESESRAAKKAERATVARRAPPPPIADERFAAVTREERDRLADRSLPPGNEEASRDRAAERNAASVPSPPMTFRGEPAGSPPVTAAGGMSSGIQAKRKEMAERQDTGKAESAFSMRHANEPPADGQGRPSAGAGRDAPGFVAPAASPCERARTLAERERFREAEDAQRACLAGDLSAPSREKGLVFLAELLDRQARFTDADAVIAEVDRRFPQSRPLDLYRQQRPMVQKHPIAVPVTR